MKRTIFFILGLIFVSVSPLLAQENEAAPAKQDSQTSNEAGSQSAEAFAIIPELKAEEESNIERNRTKATFKTNVKNCSLYLNGNFQGRSPITLTNLIEGYYLLRVENPGYIPKENFLYIEGGKARTFYIELEMTEETKQKLEARQAARERAAAEKEAKANAEVSSPEVSEPAEAAAAAPSGSAEPASESLGDAK